MTSEENLINRMRNRKRRICIICGLILIIGISLIFTSKSIENGIKAIETNKPSIPPEDQIDEALLVKKIPGLFSAYAELSIVNSIHLINISKLYAFAVFQACLLGILISWLIIELTIDRNRLTISMWERLNNLESLMEKSGKSGNVHKKM